MGEAVIRHIAFGMSQPLTSQPPSILQAWLAGAGLGVLLGMGTFWIAEGGYIRVAYVAKDAVRGPLKNLEIAVVMQADSVRWRATKGVP
ncbi:hypothetical protein AZL_b01750 (plasmid) [Azospirillum sp. B510]|uniref:hypothetical protein n=1 Tax=Azospirillum sp. (strain B510) TaxID=137722 RepID=UPI0001C4CB95|nr:hypothetical protein [Azospirillum sp. B510]BAI74838.1 hypothetical protein AZL_b01750 [Azospirillum sp. B510]